MTKELLACPKCANDKLQVYVLMQGNVVHQFSVHCPKCGKESAICQNVEPTDICSGGVCQGDHDKKRAMKAESLLSRVIGELNHEKFGGRVTEETQDKIMDFLVLGRD